MDNEVEEIACYYTNQYGYSTFGIKVDLVEQTVTVYQGVVPISVFYGKRTTIKHIKQLYSVFANTLKFRVIEQ